MSGSLRLKKSAMDRNRVNYVYDINDIGWSVSRTISGGANQGGWIHCPINGDVWIDEDGTSNLDGQEYRLW